MIETATLAGGCFWCTEAIFKRLKGVTSVIPGFSGGTRPNPSSDQVYTGMTGHAESIQIEFDPAQISFEKILEIFWATHNPTTLNQQGNDIGTQYRSAIFFHSEKQKATAEKLRAQLQKSYATERIVTEIKPFTNFYPAEAYHRNYFDKNKGAPYCDFVISPKIHKLLKLYSQDIKAEYQNEV